MVIMKGFWLDEWFILKNIKFRNYSELFANLDVMQQFPRVYLSIIKFIAEISNYNYFAVRAFPFLIQVINIILVYSIINKIIFPTNRIKGLLFVLIFLSFHTTLFYFSQLKQYTMDMLFTLVAMWYFYYLSQKYHEISIRSGKYIGMLICIFIGPFFSYTFPIVAFPIMLILFITFINDINNKKISLIPVLPLVIFALSLFLNFFTDLRFVLNDKAQYHNFDTYVMNYSNLYLFWKGLLNIIWLFTSIFFFDKAFNNNFLYFLYSIKILVFVFSVLGLYLIIFKQAEKIKINFIEFFRSLSFSRKPDFQIFFLALFLITVFLYLLKLLPMGTPRINYFCVVFISYFFITGLYYIIHQFKGIKYPLFLITVFVASFPAIASDINELKNTNLNFDQKIYNNVGNALKVAKADSLPIFVAWNEFYPSTIEKGVEGLMITSHHMYKPKDSISVYVYKKGQLDSLLQRFQLNNYILVTKYSFKIIERIKKVKKPSLQIFFKKDSTIQHE